MFRSAGEDAARQFEAGGWQLPIVEVHLQQAGRCARGSPPTCRCSQPAHCGVHNAVVITGPVFAPTSCNRNWRASSSASVTSCGGAPSNNGRQSYSVFGSRYGERELSCAKNPPTTAPSRNVSAAASPTPVVEQICVPVPPLQVLRVLLGRDVHSHRDRVEDRVRAELLETRETAVHRLTIRRAGLCCSGASTVSSRVLNYSRARITPPPTTMAALLVSYWGPPNALLAPCHGRR